ncbi:hypothetical protein JCM3774_003030 [Rhodotorula dairenensis]
MQVYLPEGNTGIFLKSTRAWLRLTPPPMHGDPIPIAFGLGDPPDIECAAHSSTYDGCIGLLQCQANTLLLLGSGRRRDDDPSMMVLNSCDLLTLSSVGCEPLTSQAELLAEILIDGSFFYSKQDDCSMHLARQRAQARQRNSVAFHPVPRSEPPPPPATSNLAVAGHYVWNSFMLEPLVTLGKSLAPADQGILYDDFLLPLVRGFFGMKRVRHGSATVELRIISRRDWHREGTRFLKRGIDVEGNVAAFAETELQLRVIPFHKASEHTVSFVQVRGSVPAYWTENPRIRGPPDLHIEEDAVEESRGAFELHIRHLVEEYGPVHAMAFLHGPHCGHLDPEARLLQVYQVLVALVQTGSGSPSGEVTLEAIDFGRHEKPHTFEQIPEKIGQMADAFLSKSGWTSIAGSAQDLEAELVREQHGVLRINCRDCCDRTNLAQFSCSAQALRKILQELTLPPLAPGSALDQAHRRLWAANGDTLSDIYTGWPSMTSNFILSGRVTHKELVHNEENSLHRLSQALQRDHSKNCATEILTGEHLSSSSHVCKNTDLLVPGEALAPLRLQLMMARDAAQSVTGASVCSLLSDDWAL